MAKYLLEVFDVSKSTSSTFLVIFRHDTNFLMKSKHCPNSNLLYSSSDNNPPPVYELEKLNDWWKILPASSKASLGT
ncbi:wsv469 [White spot syndrome virus]|uniref:Wsv469 n=5 Tax=White spot syndrome virus TaxID=342409 RepID=Q8VAF1_WSSVS|nr:wsv469 [Shrimp white spot syndrome virus]AFX59843.1 wsv469 [White spot syndrome virus]AAL33470.1 wsv469 [Shrimp white spot syndrome virus]AAL89396.1 WSSV528 [Shrimp white spot syndrome virus]AWQ60587.1 wsv469 [Shrimp white spot syndrome virus]AWQ61026.1 wsv469 [Shrimp white spot syndrome virus]